MTSPMTATKQWSSAEPFRQGIAGGNIVGAEDVIRVGSYAFYEDAYHNRPESFNVTLRGTQDDEQVEITLPAAKKIIEATNRFFAVDFNYIIEQNDVPEPGQTDPAEPTEQDVNPATNENAKRLQNYMRDLARREKLYTKFANQKRYGLIRGDAVWHITADDTKLAGQRISIHEVHPGQYFPIADIFDSNRLAGCYLVDVVQDPRTPEDKTKIVSRVQTYRREQGTDGSYSGQILSSLELYEVGKWDARNMKPGDIKLVQVLKPPTPLPPQVTSIPVYHIKNNGMSGSNFGNSEVAGIESLINGLNQSITDQDLTLVMQGLGMYWTNSGPPKTADGQDTDWEIGPRSVIEVGDGQTFGRVTGVSSVAPFIEHMNFLDDWAKQGSGTPDVAVGKVDVAVAESGIALQMQLAPMIAKNAEKELELLAEMDHMFYDLCRMWLPAYEQMDFPELLISTVVGDPMPINRQARINEIVGLLSNVPQIITLQQAHDELAKWGYQFNADSVAAVLADSAAITAATQAAVDPYAGGSGGTEGDASGDGEPVE